MHRSGVVKSGFIAEESAAGAADALDGPSGAPMQRARTGETTERAAPVSGLRREQLHDLTEMR